jgi:hypothetical protein
MCSGHRHCQCSKQVLSLLVVAGHHASHGHNESGGDAGGCCQLRLVYLELIWPHVVWELPQSLSYVIVVFRVGDRL